MSRLVYLNPDEVADAVVKAAKTYGDLAKHYSDPEFSDEYPADLKRTARIVESAFYRLAYEIRELGRRENGS